MDKKKTMSCVDCAVTNCIEMQGKFPEFCLSAQFKTEEYKEEVKKLYNQDKIQKSMIAAAEVEFEGYGKLTRVEEIMEYARKIGAKKLGIATCVGLIRESRILAKIFRHNGFEVYGVGCKVGCIPKTELGIDKKCEAVGKNTCNPIMQAKLLNEAGTELNVVVGLCAGHDSMFYKYSNALVTTAVTKDRVLGHNPVASLYMADFYYKDKLFPKD